MDADFQLAAFATNTAAVTAIQAAKLAEIPAAVMPTPRSITASCGLSLRFPKGTTEMICSLLNEKLEPGLYNLYKAVQLDNGHFDYMLI